jgi:hypothetical protein
MMETTIVLRAGGPLLERLPNSVRMAVIERLMVESSLDKAEDTDEDLAKVPEDFAETKFKNRPVPRSMVMNRTAGYEAGTLLEPFAAPATTTSAVFVFFILRFSLASTVTRRISEGITRELLMPSPVT